MRSQDSIADPTLHTDPRPALGRIAALGRITALARLATLGRITALAAACALSIAVLAAVPSSTQAQAFGGSVLIADGYILVGESSHEREPGTVWVFAREGDGWASVATLRSPTPGVGDGFGTSLARAGDFVFVGPVGYAFHMDDIGDSNAEAVPVILIRDNLGAGNILAGSGNELLVGMARETGGQEMAVLQVTDDGRMSRTASFTVPVAAGGPGAPPFALGDGIMVAGDPSQGAAHVFERSADGGDWAQTATLAHPDDPSTPTFFGSSVALAGGEVLVGQMMEAVVHRFAKVDGTWQSVGTIEPGDEGTSPGFGGSLAADGETLLVGGARGFELLRRGPAGDWERSGGSATYGAESASLAGAVVLAGQTAVAANPSADFGLGAATVFSSESGEWVQSGRLVAEHEPLPAITGGEVACEDGEAAGYDCNQVDLLGFVPWEELGAARGARLNDVWGWTDPATGREYAIVCLMDGTSFVDVTDPSNPRFLGNLPMTQGSRPNTWRDAKVFRNHVFIVADGAGEHGMQVFDLTRLRDVAEPAVFDADALYTGIASSHNVAINEATGFAYLVGSSGQETCGGGSHMVDINDPLNPVFAGCFAHPNTGRRNTGNSHDTQCVIYHGPDPDYQGREICVNSNETALSVADVTDKDNPVAIASAAYPNVAYAHQGWLTEDHRYFYSNDELDEVSGLVEATRTLVWDLEDLDDPLLLTEYFSPTQATDHNLYIRGDRLYMTNNRAGLRVLDISDPGNPVEVGHFDTTPWSADASGFDGTWSVYPYFESGTVLLSSRREGLFIVRPMTRRPIS